MRLEFVIALLLVGSSFSAAVPLVQQQPRAKPEVAKFSKLFAKPKSVTTPHAHPKKANLRASASKLSLLEMNQKQTAGLRAHVGSKNKSGGELSPPANAIVDTKVEYESSRDKGVMEEVPDASRNGGEDSSSGATVMMQSNSPSSSSQISTTGAGEAVESASPIPGAKPISEMNGTPSNSVDNSSSNRGQQFDAGSGDVFMQDNASSSSNAGVKQGVQYSSMETKDYSMADAELEGGGKLDVRGHNDGNNKSHGSESAGSTGDQIMQEVNSNTVAEGGKGQLSSHAEYDESSDRVNKGSNTFSSAGQPYQNGQPQQQQLHQQQQQQGQTSGVDAILSKTESGTFIDAGSGFLNVAHANEQQIDALLQKYKRQYVRVQKERDEVKKNLATLLNVQENTRSAADMLDRPADGKLKDGLHVQPLRQQLLMEAGAFTTSKINDKADNHNEATDSAATNKQKDLDGLQNLKQVIQYYKVHPDELGEKELKEIERAQTKLLGP